MVQLVAGIEHGQLYANIWGVTISDPDCNSRCYVLICLFFSGLFYSRDLHKKEENVSGYACNHGSLRVGNSTLRPLEGLTLAGGSP